MFSKKDIERISKDCLELKQETPEMSQVIMKLNSKFNNFESLSIAEERLICSVFHSKPDFYKIDFYNDYRCSTYWYNIKYLQYWFNLDGHGKIYDSFLPEHPLLNHNQILKDINYLNQEEKRIENLISGKLTSDNFINYYMSETNHQIKEYNKFAERANHGHFKKTYQYKLIKLHSWFIFLKVKEYFQELGNLEIVINYVNGNIVIDSYIYFHVLFRHFAERVTNYQIDKSYHFDQLNICHEWLPDQIKEHIKSYFSHVSPYEFNERFISMKLNGEYYDIWFRKMSKSIKGGTKNFLRVQSFYPVKLEKDLMRIFKLKESKVNENLSFFI